MSIHEDLGVSAEQTQSVAGHKSSKTQVIYKRNNISVSEKVSATIMSALSGQDVQVPQENCVLLRDGTVMKIRPFEVPYSPDAEEIEPSLALGSMNLDEYYKNVPEDSVEE